MQVMASRDCSARHRIGEIEGEGGGENGEEKKGGAIHVVLLGKGKGLDQVRGLMDKYFACE